MNAVEIAKAVFSRGTTTNGEQIVCVDGLTIEDIHVLCRAVLDAEASREMVPECVHVVGKWRCGTFKLTDCQLDDGRSAAIEWHTRPDGYDEVVLFRMVAAPKVTP